MDTECRILVINTYRHLLLDKRGYPTKYNELYEKYRHTIKGMEIIKIYQICDDRIRFKFLQLDSF